VNWSLPEEKWKGWRGGGKDHALSKVCTRFINRRSRNQRRERDFVCKNAGAESKRGVEKDEYRDSLWKSPLHDAIRLI